MGGRQLTEMADDTVDGRVEWVTGSWLNEPPSWSVDPDGRLVVAAERGSDAWRKTSYGFVRDSAHALLVDMPVGTATEVTFCADFDRLYDQAGLMVRVDATTWIKAGVEVSDGAPQLSAVVTHGRSDWSVAPVPHWSGHDVTLRASRGPDSVTLRARAAGEPWRMFRLVPLGGAVSAQAGPYCCAPERDALVVTFGSWHRGPADVGLHT